MIKNYFIILLIATICLLLFKSKPIHINSKPFIIRDTTFISKIINKPSETIISIIYKTDTSLRKQIIDSTVLVQTSINKNKLEVTTINTKSLVTTDVYKLPMFSYKVDIGSNGDVKIKRKIIPRILIGTGIAIAAYITYKKIKMK